MKQMDPKLFVSGVLFVLVVVTGFILMKTGKPYSVAIFNIHKLISIAAIVLLVLSVGKIQKAIPLDSVDITLIICAGVFLLASVISGGLLNLDKTIPILRVVHRIAPPASIISGVWLAIRLLTK